MPVELIMSPVMRPLVMAKALLFHPHRSSSRYVPNIIDMPKADSQDDSSKLQTYLVAKEFGTGSKVYGVYLNEGTKNRDTRLYHLIRSRAVKGAYKWYQDGVSDPIATIRAGLRSNVLLMRQEGEQLELGWHVVGHRVDAIDSYRIFKLSDGFTYQWTSRGKHLERVHNLGEKESEVRERVAEVRIIEGKGFILTVDESKISRIIALTTAMISYVDQWNTQLTVGGIYLPYQPFQVRWKRD